MKNLPLNRKILLNRLAEIEADLQELSNFQKLTLEQFKEGYNYPAAEHFLRRALEAVFDLGNHIIARVALSPGERPEGYKAIAESLGKYKIVPLSFSQGPLSQMAGYRNRMIHFYQEISKLELYQIIQEDLDDLEKFCFYIRQLIKKPQKFGFEIK